MFYLFVGVVIVGVIISSIIDEGGFLSKFALASLAAAIGCLLILWITDLELMRTLAKICGAATVIAVLLNIIAKIADF
ncbi:MAG: hypothetical protein J6J43_07705 [Oscillospiraceae bacterium]|nr:hypothetical protein [Oscillospiraceae bacterium]